MSYDDDDDDDDDDDWSSPKDTGAVTTAETRLVIDLLICSDLFHLVNSLSTLEACVVILQRQTRQVMSLTITYLSASASYLWWHLFPEVNLHPCTPICWVMLRWWSNVVIRQIVRINVKTAVTLYKC